MKKCLICGRASLPGAKLCADCSSARKRAFAATVTQPLLAAASARTGTRLLKPSQSVAATARRTAERALMAKATPPSSPPIEDPQGRRSVWLIALVAAALVVTATYAARRALVESKPEPAVALDQPASAPPAPVAVLPPVPAATFTAKPGLAAPIADPAEKPGVAQEGVPAARADAARRAAARSRAAPVEVAPPPAEPAAIVQTLAAAPAPPPAPREAPRVDPWQAMSESLARCSGGLFDRIVCDQRVRAQYCDGQWGQVPQCPSRMPNDHGQ
jgi:hypothetical protein